MLIPGIFRYIMALSVWETADGRILCTGILPYRAVRHLPTHMLISKKENVMKKAIVLSLALTLALGMTGCAKTENAPAAESSVEAVSEASSEAAEETTTEAAEETSTAAAEEASKSEGVLNYEEYMAAELDSEVVVETYVQAKQSWWEDKATVYTQDQDGAYFVYNMTCSEEDYEKLVPGTKIKVTGYKSEWSGEVEITDATFEIVEGDTYLAPVKDVTAMLGTDELIDYQNQYVAFKGMTVEAAGQDESGNDVAYLYNWDGSGTDGDDLYFSVSLNGETYSFVVESYLCDNTTDVYAAVKNLQIGDVIDMEGYLYWYEGVNPHIISVTAAK